MENGKKFPSPFSCSMWFRIDVVVFSTVNVHGCLLLVSVDSEFLLDNIFIKFQLFLQVICLIQWDLESSVDDDDCRYCSIFCCWLKIHKWRIRTCSPSKKTIFHEFWNFIRLAAAAANNDADDPYDFTFHNEFEFDFAGRWHPRWVHAKLTYFFECVQIETEGVHL